MRFRTNLIKLKILYKKITNKLYKIIIFAITKNYNMGRKRKLTANEIIDSINNTAPKIVFYTDKISIRLKNLDSIAFWKDKYPNGKIRYC